MANDVKFNRNGLLLLGSIGVVVMVFLLYRINRVETVRISEVLSASIVLAERGGKRIVEIRKMDDNEIGSLSKGLTKEGKNEYVTLGDKVWEKYNHLSLFEHSLPYCRSLTKLSCLV